MVLKTDFKDEILSDSQPYRIYNIVDSNGSTLYNNVRITKAYTPQQEGDEFGAKQINETNKAINNMVDLIYPVNAIFETTDDAFNPKTTLGGIWILFEKNHPTYTITGSKVTNVPGQDWVTLDTVSNIKNLFIGKYSFTSDIMLSSISFTNGDADATKTKIIGSDISENGKYVNALFDRSLTGNIRLNYTITCLDTSKTIYKWKRTA